MQCLSPSSIRRPGQADARDRITIPCGKCAACLSNRRSDWAVRLEQEFRVSENAHFLTLTYSDEHLCFGAISEFATLVRSDIQLFMKRLRKRCDSKLKYYVAGEYGSRTYRPHYHAIIFNLPDNNVELLLKTWQKGNVHVGTVTPASIRYTLKYMLQANHSSYSNEVQKPFSLMSKNLGISYISKRFEWHRADISRSYVQVEGGKKVRLPRYYRDKLYTKEEREKQILMMQKNEAELPSEQSEMRRWFKDEIEKKVDFTQRVERKLKDGSKF